MILHLNFYTDSFPKLLQPDARTAAPQHQDRYSPHAQNCVVSLVDRSDNIPSHPDIWIFPSTYLA